jgi:glycine cleavage system H lipoate-binding protein
MSWVQLAAAADEAGIVPRGVCDLIADYATSFNSGDWCLMSQPGVAGYKIGVITHVVQRKTGAIKKVKVHECGHELPGDREENIDTVKRALDLMDEQRGPMVTLNAPRYWGEKPWHLNVNVYTDAGRIPFNWVKPVIWKMHYDRDGSPSELRTNKDGSQSAAALRIVESGDRFRMEAMLQRLVPEPELLDDPEDIHRDMCRRARLVPEPELHESDDTENDSLRIVRRRLV